MKYEFKRVNPNQVQVFYEDGGYQMMTNEEFAAFLSQESNKLQGISFNEQFTSLRDQLKWMTDVFLAAQETGSSIAGERIEVQILEEAVKEEEDGLSISAKYKIIHPSGRREGDDISFSIAGVTGEIAPRIPFIFPTLLQLMYSGVHATKADKRALFEAYGEPTPEAYREEEATHV
ncbi:hypothetical protein ACFYKX_11185 [Cytobacillus sp. FJAT-54145]|uniref:Uncharacterized protein n=1 Tax=Cytobacillus spartinae TaxID=3299023 RepID=A0ABW6KAC7_9BACI